MFFATSFTNTMIALLVFVLVNMKRIMRRFDKLLSDVRFKVKKTVILFLLLSILTFSILLYYVYFDVPLILGVFLSLILIGMFALLTLTVLKEKNDNIKLQVKYEILMKNITEYERMLEIQRINNHENKNNLIAIKGMVNNKNKDVINYINSLIKIKQTDDQDLLVKTKKLPSGGLQGLIYQKMLLMKKFNINGNLEISKKLKKSIAKQINPDTYVHLCTILGVSLDNAIEAVQDLKEKNVSISVYCDVSNFIITVANNFSGTIELDKIDNEGYSTKGKGRGYGLALVHKILIQDKNIKLDREIIGNVFKQKLKTKI